MVFGFKSSSKPFSLSPSFIRALLHATTGGGGGGGGVSSAVAAAAIGCWFGR